MESKRERLRECVEADLAREERKKREAGKMQERSQVDGLEKKSEIEQAIDDLADWLELARPRLTRVDEAKEGGT